MPRDKLGEVAEIITALGTQEGKEALLKENIAVSKVRLENFVDNADHDNWLKYHNSQRSDLALLVDLEQQHPPDVAPVITIASFDIGATRTLVRTGDGNDRATMMLIENAPFLLDEATGAWFPATCHTDADTGVEIYQRMLNAPPTE